MKKILIISILSASLFLSGCGTLINGNTQKLGINATPSNAKISLIGPGDRVMAEGQGSLKYSLKRGRKYFTGAEYQLKVEAKGYKEQNIYIQPSISPASLVGNAVGLFFFGVGAIGALVDGSGAMWDLEPDNSQPLEYLRIDLKK